MSDQIESAAKPFEDCWMALGQVERQRCLFDLLEDP